MPRACALLSPWVDATNAGDSLVFNDGRDPTLTRAYVDNASGLFAGGIDPLDPDLSSLYADYDATFPPTLITTGTRDLRLSHCVNIAGVLRDAGADAELRVWEEMWHVFEFYPQIPEGRASLREIGEFLESRL